jgi:nitric oxide synthase oxygenase domain/subunit
MRVVVSLIMQFRDLVQLFDDLPDLLGLSSSFIFKSQHELTNRYCEHSNKGLVPALEDLVVDRAAQHWTVKWVERQGNSKLHGCVDCRVAARSFWESLDVLNRRRVGRNQTLAVEVDKRFLNRKNTCRLKTSETQYQHVDVHFLCLNSA